MSTFAEQLIAARKAKGMTQESLAQAADVARQTISSWERGRTMPDIDAVHRLSEILECDLSTKIEAEAPVEAPEAPEEPAAPAPQDAPADDAPVAPRGKKTLWIILGAAALICAVVLFLVLSPRKGAPADGGSEFDAQLYQQTTPNEAGKAFFTFDNRTWEEKSETTTFLRYDVVMREQNGVGFSVTRFEGALEGTNGAVCPVLLDAEAISAIGYATEIPAYGTFHIDGGFPKGEFRQGGFVVYGSDANGNPMIFYTLIEF